MFVCWFCLVWFGLVLCCLFDVSVASSVGMSMSTSRWDELATRGGLDPLRRSPKNAHRARKMPLIITQVPAHRLEILSRLQGRTARARTQTGASTDHTSLFCVGTEKKRLKIRVHVVVENVCNSYKNAKTAAENHCRTKYCARVAPGSPENPITCTPQATPRRTSNDCQI